jgi:4'-phosphopantetheinyl transferase
MLSELWLVDLRKSGPALRSLERVAPSLSADDRARIRRLADPGERRQRLATYVALRILLARAAGRRVRRAHFSRGSRGKPRLAGAGVDFSLSHAAGLALIGVARAHCIGVDLEAKRPLRMSQRRREEVLAVGAGVSGLPAGDVMDDAAVLRAWCRLEAFAKALGLGIDALLAELGLRKSSGRALQLAAIETAARRMAGAAKVSVRDIALPAALHGAVALGRDARPPRLRRFPSAADALRGLFCR